MTLYKDESLRTFYNWLYLNSSASALFIVWLHSKDHMLSSRNGQKELAMQSPFNASQDVNQRAKGWYSHWHMLFAGQQPDSPVLILMTRTTPGLQRMIPSGALLGM